MNARRLLQPGLILICLLMVEALGQETESTSAEPVPSYHYDFETVDEARNLPPPDEWGQVVGRSHPEDIRWRLDEAVKHSGKHSFLMELDGLANVYQTQTSCRLDPRYRYRLTGWIRTEGVTDHGLRATQARLEVLGLRKPDSDVAFRARTAGVTATTDWTEVSLDIPRDLQRPYRFLRIRCIIDGLSIGGKVWFDDIRLEPQPSILMEVGRVPGFLTPGEPKVIRIRMNTLADGDYRVGLTLTSPTGREVMKRTDDIVDKNTRAEQQFTLPMDVYGVYRLHGELSFGGHVVASMDRSILYWPGGPEQVGGEHFGLALGSLLDLNDDSRRLMADAGFGTATFDALSWKQEAFSDDATRKLIGRHLSRFREQFIEPVAVLSTVPDNLTIDLVKRREIASIDEAFWPRVTSLKPALWSSSAREAAELLGDRVARWQLGGRPSTNVPPTVLVQGLDQFVAVLKPLTFRRDLGLVFDGTERPESMAALETCAFVVLRPADPSLGPKELAGMIAKLKAPGREVWVELPVAVVHGSSTLEPARLLERAVFARAGGADRIIFGPLRNGLLDLNGDPTSLMSAAGTGARQINGLAYKGELQTHARTLLFTDGATARLAVLPTGVGGDDRLYLGQRPMRVDLDGNTAPLDVRDGRAVLPNSGTLYFVESIEAAALMTRMSVKVTPEEPEQSAFYAQSRPQMLQVEVTNYFDTPMVGQVEVETPSGWQTRGSVKPMRLDPGNSLKIRFPFSITSTEETGERLVQVRLVMGEKLMVVTRKIMLAPRAVDTHVRIITSDAGLVTVIQKITNTDARPVRLALFVTSPQTGHVQQFAPLIRPGDSAETRFDLGRVRTDNLWIGWRELSGSRFFNHYVTPK